MVSFLEDLFVVLWIVSVAESYDVNFCNGPTDGYHGDPVDCYSYYRCHGGALLEHTKCAPGTSWSNANNACSFGECTNTLQATVSDTGSTVMSPNTETTTIATDIETTTIATDEETTTIATVIETTTTGTYTVSNDVNFCAGSTDGYHGDPVDCYSYYRCHGGALLEHTKCAPGTSWSNVNNACSFGECTNTLQATVSDTGSTVMSPNTETTTIATDIETTTIATDEETTTIATDIETTTTGTYTVSNDVNFCAGSTDGYHGDPVDCYSFYRCHGGALLQHTKCAPGTSWSNVNNACSFGECTNTLQGTATELTTVATTFEPTTIPINTESATDTTETEFTENTEQATISTSPELTSIATHTESTTTVTAITSPTVVTATESTTISINTESNTDTTETGSTTTSTNTGLTTVAAGAGQSTISTDLEITTIATRKETPTIGAQTTKVITGILFNVKKNLRLSGVIGGSHQIEDTLKCAVICNHILGSACLGFNYYTTQYKCELLLSVTSLQYDVHTTGAQRVTYLQ